MKRPMSVMALALVLIVFAAGCAGRGSTELGSAMPRTDASVPTKSDLAGMWRGSFGQVMTGDSGLIHGEIESQIKDDGTYTTTWITQLSPDRRGPVDSRWPARSSRTARASSSTTPARGRA